MAMTSSDHKHTWMVSGQCAFCDAFRPKDEPPAVDMPYGTYEEYVRAAEDRGEVLGVLTGQYPARSMPIATSPEDTDDDDGSA